jgi:hypothetical protein
MTPDRTERICAWVAFVAILLGATASNTHSFKVRLLPDDLNSPILAMELLRSPADLPSVVGNPSDTKNNRKGVERLTKIDFAFIFAYGSLFTFVSLRLWQRSCSLAALLVLGAGLGAAVFDVLENLAIFRTLECLCTTPRFPSLIKWTLTFITLIVVAPVFVDSTLKPLRRTIGVLAAAVCVTTGIVGLAGILLRVDPLIEKGAAFMGLGLLFGWLFFATRATLRNGLVSALNRLAEIPGFKQLSTWPSE